MPPEEPEEEPFLDRVLAPLSLFKTVSNSSITSTTSSRRGNETKPSTIPQSGKKSGTSRPRRSSGSEDFESEVESDTQSIDSSKSSLQPSSSTGTIPSPSNSGQIEFEPKKKKSIPYQAVIDALEKINTSKTPVEKLDCLTKATNGIVSCIDEFYTDKTQHIVLGAEDKFPVLIYAIIRANLEDLYSNIAFLQDFVTEFIGDEESKYRASELTDAISYIMSLDWELRDAHGVLVPLKMIISSVVWAAKAVEKIKIDTPDAETIRNQILYCLSALFKCLGNQKDNNIYSPLQVPSQYVSLMQRYESFFMTVFSLKDVGLKLVAADQNYWVHFELKHPLYVYTKISEACISPQTD